MNCKRILRVNIVADILKRPEALDTYLGDEVKEYLSQLVKETVSPTLFILDIRDANPIDYLFTRAGFSDFFAALNTSDNNDCVFLLNNSQKKSLFWGLLAVIDGNTDITGNYEMDFSEKNNLKISVEGREIIFIGKLDEREKQILDYINRFTEVEDKAIYDHFDKEISREKIADSIKSLKKNKFIYSDESGVSIKISSVNTKLIQDEQAA